LLVVLIVLIALVARIDAAPGGGWVERAIRDAEALNRAGHTVASDEEDDEEAEDRAAERAEIASEDDEGEGEGASEDEDDAALRALLGERAYAEARLPGASEGEDDERSGLLGAGDAPALAGLAFDAASAPALGDDDAELRALLGGGDAPALAGLAFDAAGAPALGDDGEAGWSGGAGALAMLDAELAPGDAMAELDAANAGATAGAQETYEQWMRHQRPSRWGRLDVGMSWRHRRSEPIHTPAYSHDEIWLVATWRR
jgi:hypothetical protein